MALSTADQLTIWNQALSLLGERPIAALDSDGPASRILELHWATVRDSLLRGHRWNFARKRATLTAGTAPAFGWSYSYALPSDCLRVLELNGIQAAMTDADFELEGANLLTNADEAKIVYVYRVTDPTLYDSLFTEALAIKLAIACCLEITQSNSKKAELLKELEGLSLPEAVVVDAQESRSPIIPPGAGSSTLAARGGAYSYSGGSSYYPASSGNGSGTPGANGSDGWSPAFAVVEDGERRVVQITGWTGGNGSEPETGYISSSGIVSNPANGTNIRGAAGANGTGGVTSIAVSGGSTGLTTSGGPITSNGTITLGGTLEVANGGTGAGNASVARTNLGLGNVSTLSLNGNGSTVLAGNGSFVAMTGGNGSGNGSVTSVAVSGGTTGLTTSGGPITSSGTITLAGTLAIANGGTGATSASAARTALGLGTAATAATGDFEAAGAITTHAAVTSGVHGISAFGATLVDDASASAARTTLGLGNISVLNLNGNGSTTLLGNGTFAAVGTGGVTSVDASTTVSGLSFTGGPVTSSGTLALSGTVSAVTQAAVTAHQAALSVGVSQVTGFGTGVATFLATPSSSNLAAAVTGETGSGALVFGTAPTLANATLTTPILGTPQSGNLSSCSGYAISSVTGMVSGMSTFLTSGLPANLKTAIENGGAGGTMGSGALVFATSPTLTTPTFVSPVLGTPTSGNLSNCLFGNGGVRVLDVVDASHYLSIRSAGNLTANQSFSIDVGGGNRTLTVGGNFTLGNASEINLNGNGATVLLGNGSFGSAGGTGTVTSVAIAGTDGIQIDSGSPVTSSGTITLGVDAAALTTHLGLGNVSVINLNGNGSTALLGNGSFGVVSGGGSGNVTGPGTVTNNHAVIFDGTTGTAIKSAGFALGNVSALSLNGNGSTMILGNGAYGGMADGVAAFLASPTSANLRTALTDESGGGDLVFNNGPTIANAILLTPNIGTPIQGDLTNCTGAPAFSTVRVRDADQSHTLTISAGGNLTANQTLAFAVSGGNRTLTVPGNFTLGNVSEISLNGNGSTVLLGNGAFGVASGGSGDVSLAGTPDYLTISGQVITRGLIDLTTDVTGILPHGNLGTGGGGSTKFLREDGQWTTPTGSGDMLAANNLGDVVDAATARLNLGLGTSSTPYFNGVQIGHASDTTIQRSSAGQISVEGVNVLMNGGALGSPSSGNLTLCTFGADGVRVLDSDGSHYLSVKAGGNLTANQSVSFNVSGGNRTLTIPGNFTLGNASEIALNGNGSTVLAGNGTFIAASSGSSGVESYYITSDFSSTSTTLADVTGLACSIGANKDVWIELCGFWSSAAATTGFIMEVSGPSSPDFVRLGSLHATSASVIRAVDAVTGFSVSATQVTGIGSTLQLPISIWLYVENGANAGTIQFRWASEVASSAATLIRGFTMKVHRLN